MKIYKLLVTTTTAIIAGVFSMSPWSVQDAVADLNVPALTCQAPFLSQAGPMRWHESYVWNPAGNVGTWLVCPMPIETANLAVSFWVGAWGNFQIGVTNESPFCMLQITDIENQHIAQYLPNPGQKKIYSEMLDTRNPVNTIWSAATQFQTAEVTQELGSRGPEYWSVSLACYIPSGHGLNVTSVF
jgi:hypothetical protein